MPYALKNALKKLLIGAAVAGSFLWFCVSFSLSTELFFRRDVAGKVTAERIRRVRLGQSAAQVVQILGQPYDMKSLKGRGIHTIGCQNTGEADYRATVSDTLDVAAWTRRVSADTAVHNCHANSPLAYDRRTTFTYTRPVRLAGRYPMLWVHFDSSAHVSEVYAKVYKPYSLLDEDVIYSLSAPSAWNSNVDELGSAFD